MTLTQEDAAKVAGWTGREDSAFPQAIKSSAWQEIFHRDGRIGQAGKRAFDLIVAVALLILLSPILVSIALILIIHLRRSPFFIHERVGLGGRRFGCVKFRTMRDLSPGESDAFDPCFKAGTRDRTTPLTRWLRRTSLDELPQLANVLAGHMSIIGPRAVVAEELLMHFGHLAPILLMVKPGMTGLWQVSGRSSISYPERTLIELKYATTSSIWLDLRILLKTPLAVATGKGAV